MHLSKHSGLLLILLSLFFDVIAQDLPVTFRDDNGKYGLKTASGTVITPGKYDYHITGKFNEGKHYIVSFGKYGYINEKGFEIVPPQYIRAGEFSDGVGVVCMEDKKAMIIDDKGKVLQKFSYNYEQTGTKFSNGLMAIVKDNLWGFINKKGELVVPHQYFQVGHFSEGLAAVYIGGRKLSYSVSDGKWGFINVSGKLVISGQFEGVHSSGFSEGLCGVSFEKNGVLATNPKYGFIDTSGKLVISNRYQSVWAFSNGVAKIVENKNVIGSESTYGLIKKDGSLLFPLIKCYYLEGDGEELKRKGKLKVLLSLGGQDGYYINSKGEKVQ